MGLESTNSLANQASNGPIGVDLVPVLAYTTFFAEWAKKENTILVHVFPRDGEQDQWTEAYYLSRCRACRTELRDKDQQKCPRCGKTGLLYIHARRELPATRPFPPNISLILKHAADPAWEGAVSIEYAEELDAYTVQFQGCDEVTPNLSAFFDAIDAQLEHCS